MHLTSWLAFALAYTVMAFTPGPTMLLVVSYALARGRRTALAVMAGTGLGDATAMIAAMAGIGTILKASATAFLVLKFAGAACLVFLGLRIWRTRPVPLWNDPAPRVDTAPRPSAPPPPFFRTFAHLYFTTLLNPKTILFYMVFLPPFLDHNRPLLPQCLPILATAAIVGLVADTTYTTLAASLRRFIATPRLQHRVNRATGSLLIGEGLLTAASRAIGL